MFNDEVPEAVHDGAEHVADYTLYRCSSLDNEVPEAVHDGAVHVADDAGVVPLQRLVQLSDHQALLLSVHL